MRNRSLVGAMLVVVILAGCSTPPWQTADPAPATGSASPAGGSVSSRPSDAASSASPPASPSPTAVPSAVNDLATGSAHRSVTAGSITLTINYWSDLGMDQWTPEANKPLTMSLSAKLPESTKQGVFLTKVSVTPTVSAAGATVAGPAALVDKTSVSPGYQIGKPNSYQQVFILPALDPAATSVALTITYEMLLQTTPTSKQYSRQTASDNLTITLA